MVYWLPLKMIWAMMLITGGLLHLYLISVTSARGQWTSCRENDPVLASDPPACFFFRNYGHFLVCWFELARHGARLSEFVAGVAPSSDASGRFVGPSVFFFFKTWFKRGRNLPIVRVRLSGRPFHFFFGNSFWTWPRFELVCLCSISCPKILAAI
jgi:hypothetical protein